MQLNVLYHLGTSANRFRKNILSLENWFSRKPGLNRYISRKDPDIRIQHSGLHMANYVSIQKGFLSC
jgi:hypothetical protein